MLGFQTHVPQQQQGSEKHLEAEDCRAVLLQPGLQRNTQRHTSLVQGFSYVETFLANSTLPLLVRVPSLTLLQRGRRSRAAPQVPAH